MPELLRRILLVEDEESLILTLRDRFESEGYAVTVQSDGESALAAGTRSPFDLIVLDVALPKKNGFDVCRDLRQRGIQTPILMLTARGQVVDRVVGRDELLDKVWGYDATPVTRTVDVHVASLRQKLEANPSKPEYIVTVHGFGYKFLG